MYSLSTSWNSSLHKNGYDVVSQITALGFDTIELDFSLTEKVVSDILSLKESSKIKVSSLHNICPLPKEVEPDEASPDYYSLASPDESERNLAIKAAKNTINYAKMFGARAVVLHAGRVQIKDRTRDLAALCNDNTKFIKLRNEMILERRGKESGYLDNVMKSLGELVPYAKEARVALGMENRYYYREIPIEEEFDAIFDNFKIGDIYYWHDVGHAEVFTRLGLADHKTLLKKYSNRLIGIHLHDIMGMINDHNAPGFGSFDFSILKPYITKETLKVIEAHQPATGDEIRRGMEYLTKILG